MLPLKSILLALVELKKEYESFSGLIVQKENALINQELVH